MKRLIYIISLICLLTSCEDPYNALDDHPDFPPPRKFIFWPANLPSVKYPNDFFPLDSGNFWIFEVETRLVTDPNAVWISRGYDTLFVEESYEGYIKYGYKDLFNMGENVDRDSIIVKKVSAFKMGTPHYTPTFINKRWVWGGSDGWVGVGQFYTRIDTNCVFGTYEFDQQSKKGDTIWSNGWGFYPWMQREGDKWVQVAPYKDVESRVLKVPNQYYAGYVKYKNTKRYLTTNPTMPIACLYPGVGPVGFFGGSGDYDIRYLLSDYRVK